MKRTLIAFGAALVLGMPLVHAKPFKWSSAGEIATWDIHSQNNALQNGIHAAVYESLVYYNSKTFKVEPVLAESWREISPTQVRFSLRKGVKFHDGSPLTADDVVFSIQRAMAKTSNFAIYTQGIDKVVKVDANTVHIILKGPNPVLLNQLTELRIMSKAWAEKNRATEPRDIKGNEETFAHRNAMGTGPYILKEWVPDQRMVLERNPNYWGKLDTNVTQIVYNPIKSDATGSAATDCAAGDQLTLSTRQSMRLSARCTTSIDFFIAQGMIWLCSGMCATSSFCSCSASVSRRGRM